MAKSLEAFRTISEVAEELDVPKHVLRFWEVKFPQIRPMKRGGGRRYYRPEDLELLRGIRHLLHAEGYTIKGVQKILREQGVDQVKAVAKAAREAGAAGGRRRREPAPGPEGARHKVALRPASAPAPLPRSGKAQEAIVPAPTRKQALIAVVEELEACRRALLGKPAADDQGRGRIVRRGRSAGS